MLWKLVLVNDWGDGVAQSTRGDLDVLWRSWREEADLDARCELICHYLPLAKNIAKQVGSRLHPSYGSDLFGYGVIGLIDAIEKFEPSVGRFETYSFFRIRGAIYDGLRKFGWLPRRERMDNAIIENVFPVDFQALSVGGTRASDYLADRHSEPVTEAMDLVDDYGEVAVAIEDLNDQQRRVIVERYYGKRRLAEIGRDLGVTESRISQIHREALRTLGALLLRQRIA